MTDQELEAIGESVGLGPNLSKEFGRALLSKAIPEGYVVVPKEPTMEMCAAGYYTHGTPCDPEVIYRAMIAAAPSVEGEE